MCGLVFMGSKILGYRDFEIFEDLIFCDTLRGNHSTGVCAIYKSKETGTKNKMMKAAMGGPEFISSGYLDEVLSIKNKTGAVTTVERPIAVFGHNRFATKGEVNAKNAHPFIHGNITLAHNGTLTGQHRLVDYKNFEVDSENIAYSISQVGFEETLKNLDGAFTLIWHDSKLNTVNIIRNRERPFHLARTTSGDWFGASEKHMLLWILGRQKSPVTVAEEFECEPGMQYVFDTTNGVFSFKEKVKHELPTFTRFQYSHYSGYSGYYEDYGNWPNRRDTATTQPTPKTLPWQKKEEEENKILKSAGLRVKVGDQITFNAYGTEANTVVSSPYCTYNGYVYPDATLNEYIEVVAHGQQKALFKENGLYIGKIVKVEKASGFGMITITVGVVSETTVEIDIGIKNTPRLPMVANTPNEEEVYNKILSEYEIDLLCGEDLYFEAKGFRHPINDGEFGVIYGNCIEEGFHDLVIDSVFVPYEDYHKGGIYSGTIHRVMLENKQVVLTVADVVLVADNAESMKTVEPQTEEDEDDAYNLVVEYNASALSDLIDDEDVPFDITLGSTFESERVKDVTTLKTGEVFTRGTWALSHHSTCKKCNKNIIFEESSQVSIINSEAVCKNCLAKASEKKKDATIAELTNEVLNKHNIRFRHGESLDFTSTNFMSYGNHSNKGSIFGETDSKIHIVAPDSLIADFYSKTPYTGIISSARESGDIVTIFVTKIAVKARSFFHCEKCNQRKPLLQRDMSNKEEYVCIDCSQKQEKRKILSLVKKEKDVTTKRLVNGHIVTKYVWESKMCSCKQCSSNIPWEEASVVTLVGGIPLCKTCESKVA